MPNIKVYIFRIVLAVNLFFYGAFGTPLLTEHFFRPLDDWIQVPLELLCVFLLAFAIAFLISPSSFKDK